MKLLKPRELLDSVLVFERKNRATILTGLGVAGLWTTAYMAYKAGPQAERILEEKRRDFNDIRKGDKEAKRAVIWESIKEMTPVIAPPIILGGVSTACIIGSHTVSQHRIAALSAAYTITDSALREYRGKVKKLLGEKKAQQVREAISHDHVQNNPPPTDSNQVIITGNGDVLCFDEYSGRYFYSNAEKIGSAILKLSYLLSNEQWISLNELYLELGLSEVKMGYDLGWGINHTDSGKLPIYYTATMTEDNRPCIAIQFEVELRDVYY